MPEEFVGAVDEVNVHADDFIVPMIPRFCPLRVYDLVEGSRPFEPPLAPLFDKDSSLQAICCPPSPKSKMYVKCVPGP